MAAGEYLCVLGPISRVARREPCAGPLASNFKLETLNYESDRSDHWMPSLRVA